MLMVVEMCSLKESLRLVPLHRHIWRLQVIQMPGVAADGMLRSLPAVAVDIDAHVAGI